MAREWVCCIESMNLRGQAPSVHRTAMVAEPGEDQHEMTTEIKVGCCEFTGGQRNYFSQFKLVEIQQTFYQLPRLPDACALGATLVVFQCPASFEPTPEHTDNLKKFFATIDRSGWRFVWEPRGSWPPELVARLCQELDLIHGVDPFKDKPVHGAFQYFRLHGNAGYHYRYEEGELKTLLHWAQAKLSYVLFNNTWMKEDAGRFQALLPSWTSK